MLSGALALPATPVVAAPSAPAAPYQRAISLAPHITELIFAAGAGGRIAGTIARSDYPPAARDIPRVGDGVAVSQEVTLALRPDVALAWYESGATRQLAPVLERAGAAILFVAPESLDDIPAAVRRMGRLFGTESVAQDAAQALDQRIAALRQANAAKPPVRVFIEISNPPLFTIASDPVIADALLACGGVNVFADLPNAAAQVSREGVLLRQPQAVIAPVTTGKELQSVRDRWSASGLDAARRGQVYDMDPDKIFRPGPRMVDATERLCAILDAARAAQAAQQAEAPR